MSSQYGREQQRRRDDITRVTAEHAERLGLINARGGARKLRFCGLNRFNIREMCIDAALPFSVSHEHAIITFTTTTSGIRSFPSQHPIIGIEALLGADVLIQDLPPLSPHDSITHSISMPLDLNREQYEDMMLHLLVDGNSRIAGPAILRLAPAGNRTLSRRYTKISDQSGGEVNRAMFNEYPAISRP